MHSGVEVVTLLLRTHRHGQYLVTGIAGFIGSALARALLLRGDEVRGIDNFSTGRRENIAETLGHIDLVKADILDPHAIAKACAGVAERWGDIKHSLADITSAEAALGYKPIIDFEEGLRRTISWYRGSQKSLAKSAGC